MGNRFDSSDRRSDDVVHAIHEAAHLIATAIREGFNHMASVEDQALADLTNAVTNLGTAITAEIAALQDALGKAGVDNSPAIEKAVSNISALTNSLTNSIPAPAPAPAPAPTPAPTPGA